MIALTDSEGAPLTSEEISVRTKVPADYALKVLKWLRRRKLVAATRGRRGGIRLTCDPKKTTLLEVVDAIDPIERITACPLGRPEHLSQLCPLHGRLDELLAQMISSLGGISLHDVARSGTRPPLCRPTRGELASRRAAKRRA
jgi:Rrf2 family protein